MKAINEINVGDYIFHTMKNDLPGVYEAYKVLDVYEQYDETIYELTWFGHTDIKCVLHVKSADLNKSEILYPNARNSGDVFITEHIVENNGLGKYILNKDHNKEYEVIQEHILYKKEIRDGFYDINLNPTVTIDYQWNKPSDLVLYKALYDCPDGPYFIRHEKDFYNKFTRIV